METVIRQNDDFFDCYEVTPRLSGKAVDLGCGPGYQTISLARRGFEVTAIDFCLQLLQQLKAHVHQLPVKIVNDDFLRLGQYVDPETVECIVCMKDTLTHLDSFENVEKLLESCYQALEKGGNVILTFRDLSFELKGLDRFIPVKSDDSTIFTCFLEYEDSHVKVHDIMYTKQHGTWVLKKSFYRKLRISQDAILSMLTKRGYSIKTHKDEVGMVTIIASK